MLEPKIMDGSSLSAKENYQEMENGKDDFTKYSGRENQLRKINWEMTKPRVGKS